MAWRIRPVTEFEDCSAEWQALARGCGDTPLLDAGFVVPLLAHFATGEEVIATLNEGGRTLAMGIFVRTGRFAWSTMQPANAPLGLFVCAPETAGEATIASLARALSFSCLLLGITQRDPDIFPRPAAAARVGTLDYIDTARITVPGTFEAWWAKRSKNLRHDVSRQKNRFKRDGIDARLATLRAPADMERAVADYGRLESKGWKGEIDSAVTEGGPQARFYAALLAGFAVRGEALVAEYLLNDEVVACDLCLLRAGVLYILKTAYDESRQGTSSAHLMRHDLFSQMFDDGRVKKVEFYGRAMDWHRRLTDEIRTMYHLNWYRWPILRRRHRVSP